MKTVFLREQFNVEVTVSSIEDSEQLLVWYDVPGPTGSV